MSVDPWLFMGLAFWRTYHEQAKAAVEADVSEPLPPSPLQALEGVVAKEEEKVAEPVAEALEAPLEVAVESPVPETPAEDSPPETSVKAVAVAAAQRFSHSRKAR